MPFTALQTALNSGFTTMLSIDGTEVIYTDRGGAGVTITVQFTEQYLVLEPVNGIEIGSRVPMAKGWTADLPDAGPEDLMIINGTVYEVMRREPDGDGVTDAYLTKSLTLKFLQDENGNFILTGDGQLIEIIL